MTASSSWVPVLRFTVPGIPLGKGRPRFSVINGGVRTYTDSKTKGYEQKVKLYARSKNRGSVFAPHGVPVRVDILAQYPRPQRLLTKSSPDGLIPKFNKQHGDLDNHIKAALDSLNGEVFDDDSQVCIIRAEGVYCDKGQKPCSTITIFLPLDFANKHHTSTTEKHRAILEASPTSVDR